VINLIAAWVPASEPEERSWRIRKRASRYAAPARPPAIAAATFETVSCQHIITESRAATYEP